MTHRKESASSVSEKLQKVVKTSEPRVLDISQGAPSYSLLLFDVKQEKDKLLDINICFAFWLSTIFILVYQKS